jgi:hypothetical protein
MSSFNRSFLIVALALACSSSSSPSAPGDAADEVRADASTLADAAMAPPPAGSGDAGAAASCQNDDDCRLVNDCCTCQAIPVGEKAAVCDPNRACVVSTCAQYQGVSRAHCSAGRCVLGFACDPAQLLCKRVAPLCPAGQVPQVVNGCYGECVDARQCLSVPTCAACRSTDLCVRAVAAPAVLHCQSSSTTSLEER